MAKFSKIPLLVATSNRGKAREIAACLRGLPFRVLSLEDLGLRADCPERGATFERNARDKGIHYSRRTGHLTLAEDSGLVIAGLEGNPGVRSARFSGPRATDEKNIRKALRLLKGLPPERRRARFVCVMALARDGKVLKVVRGRVRGTIAPAPRGGGGFGYDPIFYYHPLGKTFGEIPSEAKNKVSHRGRALARMTAFLRAFAGLVGGETAAGPPRRNRCTRP